MEGAVDLELRTVEHSIPLDVLTDLISRFIINVPESAKQNLIRICFQIELAYWYYLDFYVSNESRLRGCTFKEFAAHVFQHLPFLQLHYGRLDNILEEWRDYKQSVPTYGAILLCEGNTHVLLVQSYWAKSSWGFPKGKVNENEDPAHCAIREVYEETGFDISTYIDPETYFEAVINEQLVRLYVITGISKDTKFQPKTRFEIKACEWFPVADLPNNKKDITPKVKMGISSHAFFMVLPFVKRIKGLLSSGKSIKRLRHKSLSFSESESATKTKFKQVLQQSDSNERNNKEEKKKGHSKRQLFNDDEFVFSAPSWLNFKFDKAAILECIP
ncbi:putative manganese ion binding protein [Trypoxylus dichotomus]